MIQNDKPRVIVKNKNLQFIFDYCIESKTPFSSSPRLSGDEWEIEFKISDIMGAVALGMFLRENRIEPVGIQAIKPQTVVAATKTKVTKTATKKSDSEISEPAFTNTQPSTFNEMPVATTPVAATQTEEEDIFEETELATEEAVETGGFSPEMLFDEN